MKTEEGVIVNRGMGGFLRPPGHPEHTQSVETDLWRRPENRGSMSLSAAVDCEWLGAETRAAAKRLLDGWKANPPAIESPEIQEWILQVLGYYRGCFRNPDKSGHEQWHASNLLILERGHEACVEEADEHAGVRQIRVTYPDFKPTADHFARAYWGSKPEGGTP